MTPFAAVLAVLCTYRLTLIVTADELTEAPRDAVLDWLDDHDHPKFATLLGCPWCLSVHLGVLVALSAYRWGSEPWWQVLTLGLTASAVTGILATYAKP